MSIVRPTYLTKPRPRPTTLVLAVPGGEDVAFTVDDLAPLTVEELDGIPSVTPVRTLRFDGATVTDDGGGQATVAIGPSAPASALDDLTDVVITAPAAADRLRFDGAVWVNSTLTWEPMVDGTGLVMLDGLGNIMRHEVAY
jgi:hypothetical protein